MQVRGKVDDGMQWSEALFQVRSTETLANAGLGLAHVRIAFYGLFRRHTVAPSASASSEREGA